MLSCQIGEWSTARGSRQEINKEHYLTACMCIVLNVYKQLLCFSVVFCTYKYWFRLNSLSSALSTGKRHQVRFTWNGSVVVDTNLPCNLEVRGWESFLKHLYSIMINSLMFSPWSLSCFLRIKHITMWKVSVLSSAQRINIFTSHALQNVLGFSTATKHIYNWNKTRVHR